jgi:hypothetical protein
MFQRYLRLAGLTMFFGLLLAPAAHASARISVQIGVPAPILAPVPVAPVPVAAPYPEYVWRPGYYVWTSFGYRWVPAGWARPYGRPGWGYQRWERERRGWDRDDRRWDRGRRDWDRDRRR